ncbi:hypothetical protein M422DRAFT_74589 [Sphaerobolus stellatus SS14]|nr:hypothetical protein M422DRAFT_74589 [Sphaerobolus stellatus SS14]
MSIAQQANLLLNPRALRTHLTFDNVKTALFFYVTFHYGLEFYRDVRAKGPVASVYDAWVWAQKKLIFLYLRLPSNKAMVTEKMDETRVLIRSKLIGTGPNIVRHLSLPRQGRSAEEIEKELETMQLELAPIDYKEGKLSGAVYHGGADLEKIINMAFQKYTVSNPLHPEVFPEVRKMEAEIVAMCLTMFNNPDGAGSTTSGGTESILMAVKTHRDWARDVKGITRPEIVIPSSAHPAFKKAGDYFKIKVREVPVDPVSRKAPIRKVKRAINANTIMIVGSAINFPDGAMEDIVGLGKLAQKYKIGLHVDCCLGSFIMPFLAEAGFPVEPFDFRVPGVTSISCDTHKYGFAPKGSSVVMYRSAELRKYQYFISPEWAGGLYASPTIAGSRPGALIAGAWAVMQHLGHDGYLASCRKIVTCAKQIQKAINEEIPELYVLGEPPASVVAFASNDLLVNVLHVGDAMGTRGWHLNGLRDPAGVHIACTYLTSAEKFIEDLKACVQEVKGKPVGQGTLVTIYGLGSSSAVGPELVTKVASIFLDTLLVA